MPSLPPRLILPALLAGTAFAASQIALAQPSAVETYHVQGNVYMLAGAGANVAVQIGDEGVLVVDTGAAGMGDELLAAIRELSDGPIRWIINTVGDPDHTGGNETISQAGMTVNGNPAAIVAHEKVLARMSDAGRSVAELPLNTFFEEGRDFYFNGEAIFLRRMPNAHTDGDIYVYFRGSDVLVAGDVFVTTDYPVIDAEAGGSIDGFVEGMNAMLDVTVPAYLQEGGTYIIPGHGRVSDEADLVEYRDMALFIRDRIRHMAELGMSLREVMAARPSLDYDPRYGRDRGPWTTAMFIEAIYNDQMRKVAER
jgi:glyoxylase-like metal-dependent hydrolase (beta-lactamase superfamily II)